jgi:hypothetical protein
VKKLFLLCLLVLSTSFASAQELPPCCPPLSAAVTVPTTPDVLLGEWRLNMYNLVSLQRNGEMRSMNTVNFTVDITKKEASFRSEVNLIGKMRGGGTVQTYYRPDSSEAQIQAGFWVFSLETGLSFLVIDCLVFTSDDGTDMWGQVSASLYDENSRKKALYKGDVSFYRNFGGKGGL